MGIYSHSRLSSFEQCKQKYKFRYIDKIKPDFKQSIESHLGSSVHDTFEWLYNEVLRNKLPALDETLEFYINRWQKGLDENIKIVKEELTSQDYFEKGIKFVADYYMKNTPFKDGTLELEKRIYIQLSPDSPHKLVGYIDRLVYNKEKKQYEIHDYKTANFLPAKEKFEQDRQLALYAIGIKQLHGQHHPVLLTWHYLSYNMRIDSRRTDEQLDKLKKDTLKLINEIEQTTEFPPTESILCNWCEYKSSCPLFKVKVKGFTDPFE